jgi:hypothetical protein
MLMNSDLLKPIKGHDVGIKVDMFGNETVYLTKPKGITVQPTLDDFLRDKQNLDRITGGEE